MSAKSDLSACGTRSKKFRKTRLLSGKNSAANCDRVTYHVDIMGDTSRMLVGSNHRRRRYGKRYREDFLPLTCPSRLMRRWNADNGRNEKSWPQRSARSRTSGPPARCARNGTASSVPDSLAVIKSILVLLVPLCGQSFRCRYTINSCASCAFSRLKLPLPLSHSFAARPTEE